MTRTLRCLLCALSFGLPQIAFAVADGDSSTVTVMGTIVDNPDCTVNGNDIIDVNFGDNLITRKVDGVNYKKQIPYTLYCSNPIKSSMRLKIIASTASFNPGLVYTSKQGLGIQLYNGSIKYTPGQYINFAYVPEIGGNGPTLYAVPVAQNNLTLSSGYFSGTGTMLFEYQ